MLKLLTSIAIAISAIGASRADVDKESLDKISKGLRSNKFDTMLASLDEARKMGKNASPIAAEVSRLILSQNKKISDAAIEAYEKIEPEVHPILVSVVVEKNKALRYQAVNKLELMGKGAKSAMPILLYHLNQEVKDAAGDWAPLLKAMVAIDPADNFVVSQVLGFASAAPVPKTVGKSGSKVGGPVEFETARATGVGLIEKIVVSTDRKVRALLAAIGNSRVEKIRLDAIEQLATIGPEAKLALPTLRQLKTDSAAKIRDAASEAVKAIDK